jgi:4-amino-4-deoxy-L-arabinose transferase-like glycosyltransferase
VSEKNTMISNIRQQHPIYLLVALFFLFKLQHLQLPYFWDELGVYSRAALHMFDHQISLLPDAIPPELSRGHPLLCAVIFAIGYRILGPQVWAGHLIALLWSCGLLLLLYRMTRYLFEQKTALLACALLAVQPVFIAQSSMVLPEIMLAFFCTAAVHAYFQERFWQVALFSSFAILTKETAVVLPVSLGLPILLTMLRHGISRKKLTELSLISVPLLIWGIFLLIQKMQNGWFFFPLHTGYVSFSLQDIVSRISYYLSFLGKGQGRYLWTAVTIAAAVLFLRNNARLLKEKASAFMAAEPERSPVVIILLYTAVSLAVSALNFHLARYILLVMPVLCCLIAAQIMYVINNFKTVRLQYLLLPFLAVSFFYYKGDIFNIDADMGYADIVAAQQNIVTRLNQHADASAIIGADFPVAHGLMDKRAGYSAFSYETVLGCGNNKADYVITSSFDDCKPAATALLLQEVKTRLASMRLYKNTVKTKQ